MNLLRLLLVACLAAIVNCDTSNEQAADVGKCKEGEDGEGCADVDKKSKEELARERKEANERRKLEREERKKQKEAEKKAKREAREKEDKDKRKKKSKGKGKKQEKKKSSGKNKKGKKESKKKEEKPKKKDKKKEEKKKKEQAKKEEEKKKQQQKKEKEQEKKKKEKKEKEETKKQEKEEKKKKKQEKKKKDDDKKKQKKKEEEQKKKEERKKKKEKKEKAERKAQQAKQKKKNSKEKKAKRALNARKGKLDFGGIWGSRALDYCDAFVDAHEQSSEIHEDTCPRMYRIVYEHFNEYADVGINGMLGKMFGGAMNLKVPNSNNNGPGSRRMKTLVERQPWYDAACRVAKVTAWATIQDNFNETISAMDDEKAFKQRETTVKKHGMPLLFLAQQGQATEKLYQMYMDHEVIEQADYKDQVFTYRPVPKATVLGVGYKPEEDQAQAEEDEDEDLEDLDELNELMEDM